MYFKGGIKVAEVTGADREAVEVSSLYSPPRVT